jgi:hypothetical protein
MGIFHLGKIFDILKVTHSFHYYPLTFHYYFVDLCYSKDFLDVVSSKLNSQSLESFHMMAVIHIKTFYFFEYIYLFHSQSQKYYEIQVILFKICFLYC